MLRRNPQRAHPLVSIGSLRDRREHRLLELGTGLSQPNRATNTTVFARLWFFDQPRARNPVQGSPLLSQLIAGLERRGGLTSATLRTPVLPSFTIQPFQIAGET